ncbi:MAG TPA: hypothetical protein VFM63_15320, partial [Pyrinomonadaceae bacterium]|nr:hypothetical protein [Pyrinomonadaceae bacterium]
MNLILLLVVGPTLLAAQNDLSFYPVRTLAEATKDSVSPDSPKADYYFDGRQLKSRSTVTFTGEVRKLTEKHRKFVELWLETRNMPANVINALQQEAQFQEGKAFYWMPIRQKTLELLQKDTKKGDRVDVYTILAGAVQGDT